MGKELSKVQKKWGRMEEATEEIAESAINDAAEINKKIFIKENIGKAGTTTTKMWK